jgi:hypothetical protein
MITFVTIDPASYSLGMCLVQNGEIINSWTIQENSGSIAIRFMRIAERLQQLDLPILNKIYVEVLNTNTHRRCVWSIGAILAGLGKFCTEKTVVVDKEVKNRKTKKALLTPTHWQSYFDVAHYNSGDKDKDNKILAAFEKRFPEKSVHSADEAVAIFLATVILEES